MTNFEKVEYNESFKEIKINEVIEWKNENFPELKISQVTVSYTNGESVYFSLSNEFKSISVRVSNHMNGNGWGFTSGTLGDSISKRVLPTMELDYYFNGGRIECVPTDYKRVISELPEQMFESQKDNYSKVKIESTRITKKGTKMITYSHEKGISFKQVLVKN